MNSRDTQAPIKRSASTLFLDFDGVLHPNLALPDQYFGRLPLLEQALGNADLQIVISSSWRFQSTLSRLRALFPASMQARIMSTTGPAHIGRHARWHEITAYCAASGITDWRALDDAHFEFPSPCEQLIRCEGSRGIGPKECDALAAWLDHAV